MTMAGTGHVDSGSDYGSDILTDLVYLVYGPEQVRSWWPTIGNSRTNMGSRDGVKIKGGVGA